MTAPSRPSAFAAFVRRWGWRAYAVPALAVTTVVVLVAPSAGGAATPAARTAAGDGIRAAATDRAEQLSGPQVQAAVTDPADATACAANTLPQYFVVSIAAQHAWACEASRLVLSTPVTTGVPVPGRETLVGSWVVQAKQTDRDLVGPGYVEHVDYWMPYDGDFGLHDATWQTFAFGTDGWRTDGSHGCVHLPLDAMAWVYQWAQVGTTITIDA